MLDKVWVLTYEVNDYDQHGEYFVAVFKDKPTSKELKYFLHDYAGSKIDVEHVLSEGGRIGHEYLWYNLECVEFS